MGAHWQTPLGALVLAMLTATQPHAALGTDDVAAVRGLFKIETVAGSPITGYTLAVIGGATAEAAASATCVTSVDGACSLMVAANATFVVRGQLPPRYQDLYIYGAAGSIDFNYTTFMGTRVEARALGVVYPHLSPYSASKGMVVVGMDRLLDPHAGLAPSNLAPAVGASAFVRGFNSSGYGPWIFDVLPQEGRRVTPKSSSFVTFPYLDPATGTAGCAHDSAMAPAAATVAGTASATAPPGQVCLISPGFTAQAPLQPVQVWPDAISVVSFICSHL
eukprot:m.206885 g.206885  ORF g.206885 m.206885 type:complete len:277 (+) comp25373_c0_seq1:73-903(+)